MVEPGEGGGEGGGDEGSSGAARGGANVRVQSAPTLVVRYEMGRPRSADVYRPGKS